MNRAAKTEVYYTRAKCQAVAVVAAFLLVPLNGGCGGPASRTSNAWFDRIDAPAGKGATRIRGANAVEYEDGTPMVDGSVVDGMRSGTWISWYPSGAPSSIGFYEKGRFEGPWLMFTSDGRIDRVGRGGVESNGSFFGWRVAGAEYWSTFELSTVDRSRLAKSHPSMAFRWKGSGVYLEGRWARELTHQEESKLLNELKQSYSQRAPSADPSQ